MRKRQQALGEQRLHFGGRGDAVGDYVIDEIGAHRPEIAEPRQRHRRGSQREDFAPRVHRVSIEVDQQVDAVVADAPRGFVESLVAAVCEMIERDLDSGAQRGNLTRPDRIGECLEVLPVVALPDLRQQEGDSMSAKIRRYVSQAEP